MGGLEIKGFQFDDLEGVGSVIEYGEYSSRIAGDYLLINSHRFVSLSTIDCFYAFASGDGDGYDVKIFYKDTRVESLGRTEDHESAKRWVEESNGLLGAIADAKC